MKPEEFCRWLHGAAEINGPDWTPTPEQWAMIKEHLQLLYTKVTSTPGKVPKTLEEAVKEMESLPKFDRGTRIC